MEIINSCMGEYAVSLPSFPCTQRSVKITLSANLEIHGTEILHQGAKRGTYICRPVSTNVAKAAGSIYIRPEEGLYRRAVRVVVCSPVGGGVKRKQMERKCDAER